jgi:hypothetical protein
VSTDPLPNNGHPIVARVCFHRIMFTEPLSSNGSIVTSLLFIKLYRPLYNDIFSATDSVPVSNYRIAKYKFCGGDFEVNVFSEMIKLEPLL